MKWNGTNIYLFSVDLEDVRLLVENGSQYAERVPLLTERYLAFLEAHNCKATFFVVGDVAKAYPLLIKRIVDSGHEIACHSNKHLPLDEYTKNSFRADITENMKMLYDAGAKRIYGFRAPIYSMTEKTTWVYKELSDLGFVYSSSVLPAKNPLYGWPQFGREAKLMDGNIWELPISIFKSQLILLPYTGGIYLRMLPFFVVKKMLQRDWKQGLPIVGYTHPYDIDSEQERFMHPGINNNRLYNKLMYLNRKSLLGKFDKIVACGGHIMTYIEYVNNRLVRVDN